MALSMRRIGMLVTVVALMAAMLVASAMPAMAAPGNGAEHYDKIDAGGNDISGVFTPSGAANVTIQNRPDGNNAGGTGGGGANVGTSYFGYNPGGTAFFDPEVRFISTPSGNRNATAHQGPTK